MIQKYRFGTPFYTGAVVQDIPCETGAPAFGTVEADENGFQYSITMGDKDAVYGLGEAMRGINKRGGVYESYNLDHRFTVEDVLSLYGAHNFLVVDGEQTFGLFFDFPGKLRFDVGFTNPDEILVSAPEANLDLYVISGDTPRDIVRTFRKAIGQSYIPPKWAMGFAQSRWGYEVPEDFRQVADRYRENGIPLDAIYMDIDYMDAYKDFTVDPAKFPDFPGFVQEMQARNVHLVPIIDAAVKIEDGYPVCDEGLEKGYFCTGKDGEPFQTAAWPGPTYLPDVLQPDVRTWFGNWYLSLTEQGIDGFWNDMNEPAVFYTKESMERFRSEMREFLAKDFQDEGEQSKGDSQWFRVQWAAHKVSGPDNYTQFYHKIDGKPVLHDRVHNLYGAFMTRAAGEALERRYPDSRKLLFSRSSFIGMHRYGGVWTGDNSSIWPHILLNLQQLPGLNMCGFLYAGADLGGFGGDTSRDLLLRWLALGVFTPLMRNHAAKNTRKQECYQFDHPEDFAHVIGVRYRLLPYLYSELVQAALSGDLLFRPLAFDYPDDPIARETADQLMLGDGLMIAPVLTQNASGRMVYLPEPMLLVKFMPDGSLEQTRMDAGIHYISVALNEVPVFIRREHILPLAKPAMSVPELDEEHLELLGWVTREATLTLYRDDGYSRDYSNPAHYTVLRMGGDLS